MAGEKQAVKWQNWVLYCDAKIYLKKQQKNKHKNPPLVQVFFFFIVPLLNMLFISAEWYCLLCSDKSIVCFHFPLCFMWVHNYNFALVIVHNTNFAPYAWDCLICELFCFGSKYWGVSHMLGTAGSKYWEVSRMSGTIGHKYRGVSLILLLGVNTESWALYYLIVTAGSKYCEVGLIFVPAGSKYRGVSHILVTVGSKYWWVSIISGTAL